MSGPCAGLGWVPAPPSATAPGSLQAAADAIQRRALPNPTELVANDPHSATTGVVAGCCVLREHLSPWLRWVAMLLRAAAQGCFKLLCKPIARSACRPRSAECLSNTTRTGVQLPLLQRRCRISSSAGAAVLAPGCVGSGLPPGCTAFVACNAFCKLSPAMLPLTKCQRCPKHNSARTGSQLLSQQRWPAQWLLHERLVAWLRWVPAPPGPPRRRCCAFIAGRALRSRPAAGPASRPNQSWRAPVGGSLGSAGHPEAARSVGGAAPARGAAAAPASHLCPLSK